MRKLTLLILCGACWLGGHHCGRQPGSPDISGWILRQIRHLAASYDSSISDASECEPPEARPSSADEPSALPPARLPRHHYESRYDDNTTVAGNRG